jgi:dihydrofolate reductase
VSVPVALIAAVAENGVIGANNSIPWRLPSDFAYFKRMTVGKPLIMGRKTFDSIGKPLPERVNIVVSRRSGYQPEGVLVMNSLRAALEHAQTIAAADGAGEVMIGGGEAIYREAMPLADRLYISHVALSPEGDSFFPQIEPEVWQVVDEPDVPLSGRDSASFRTKVYTRRHTDLR